MNLKVFNQATYDNLITKDNKELIQKLDEAVYKGKIYSSELEQLKSNSSTTGNRLQYNQTINFSKGDIKARQKFLHKRYFKNTAPYNLMLENMIETKNIDLYNYFIQLNKELEEKATENGLLPKKPDLYS